MNTLSKILAAIYIILHPLFIMDGGVTKWQQYILMAGGQWSLTVLITAMYAIGVILVLMLFMERKS